MIKNCIAVVIPFALSLTLVGCEEKKDPGFQGIVEFEERVVGFQVGGRVESIGVKRGDVVAKGQVIAAQDDALARSAQAAKARQAESARAELALLEIGARPEELNALSARLDGARARETTLTARLGRQRALRAGGVSSHATVEGLEGELAAARSEVEALTQELRARREGARAQELESARGRASAAQALAALEAKRLEHHQLTALRGGVVLDVHVKPGEFARAGAPVATLGDPQAPHVDVFVPQGKLGGLREGTPATLRVDSCARTLSGSVERVGRRTEFTPRFVFSEQERPNLVIRVRVRIEDPQELLHAGIPAFVAFAPVGGKP